MDLPWIEKYRPKNFEDVIFQEEITLMIKNILNNTTSTNCNIPHLIFYGLSGCGKTTISLIIAKQVFKHKYPDRVLELNASNERGIKVVREKIKKFAKQAIDNNDTEEHNIPPIKLIILDEADAMTDDSQFALRRIIEMYSKTTRFILICNYITRIIEPLASRCTKFRFKPINLDGLKNIILNLGKKEEFKVSDQVIENIYNMTKGDLRKAINIIQQAKYLDRVEIKNETINEIGGIVTYKRIDKIVRDVIKTDYITIQGIIKDFLADGYSVAQFINELVEYITSCKLFTEDLKGFILFKLSEVDYNLNKRGDEYIQMINILSLVYELYRNQD
jgi:replication factor C subunit 2/4